MERQYNVIIVGAGAAGLSAARLLGRFGLSCCVLEGAARTLATPWEDTVFFAGEALDLQYPSTVAGALGSGEHTARRVLESRSRN